MKSTAQILILLLIVFNSAAQDTFYVRCVNADNLKDISKFLIKTESKKVEIDNSGKSVVQINNFKRGTEIEIIADMYTNANYHRATRKEEIAAKYNGARLLIPGDTIVIELQLEKNLLLKRWKEEDLIYPIVDTNNIITDADTNPIFIDDREFSNAISSSLHFPKHVIDKNAQGTVYISVIVETDGTFSNISVLQSLEPQLDRIALRAVRNLKQPSMLPALNKDDEPVRTRLVLPIKFNLN